jgi:uncharacterized Ntn-hydrolase superfamily protein
MTYRPVSTYSIVANDGEAMGVAVQSHWFSVGSVVPWAESGVGVVAVQAFPNPAHGPEAMALLGSGAAPAAALASLLAGDAEAEFRQLALTDARGRVIAHTGARCIPEAGHFLGDRFSAQANLMDRGTVWGSMAAAFEQAEGDLAERMLVALEAAEAEGGDLRGRQSAAIVVVPTQPPDAPGADRVFDLRVEDHVDPVTELRRLVEMRRAYLDLTAGDDLVSKGDLEAALAAYRAGMERLPAGAIDGEAAFWTGVALAAEGRFDEALEFLREAQTQHDAWVRLVPRLTVSGILPDDAGLIDRLVSAMTRGVASAS